MVWFALGAVLMMFLSYSLTGGSVTKAPIVGTALTRLSETFVVGDSVTTNAAANAGIRRQMWSYALKTTYQRHKFIGQGTGRYVEVNYAGNDISGADTGVHNSFVGYVFYAGYPAGILVTLVFLWAMGRGWRQRHVNTYIPALLAIVVAGTVIAATNVALEGPYLGGPIWLALGALLGLTASGQPEMARSTWMHRESVC